MNTTEILVEQGCFEILVDYDWEESAKQIEEGHGYHDVGGQVNVTLNSIEVVVCGVGIQILPLLNQQQKDRIIEDLSIY